MAGLESPMDMYFAAKDGDIERMKQLAKAGASFDFRLCFTLLQWTIIWDRFDVAGYLVRNNCDINRKAVDGRTAVLMAAEKNREYFVQLLVKHGAHLDGYTGVQKWTLLHYAVFYGWTLIVERILERGAVDVNAESSDMRTPLMLAIQNGNEGIVELLIGAGAEFHRCDAGLKNVLHYACSTLCYSREGLANLVSRILETGETNLNAKSKFGWSPLLYALNTGKEDIAEILIQAGVVADTDRLPSTKLSVLHHCITRGWPKLVRMVIEKWGCDLNPTSGLKPWHLALQSRNIEIIKLLVVLGADVHFIIDGNKRALYVNGVIIVNGDNELIRLLVAHGAYFGAIEQHIFNPDLELQELFLEDAQLLAQSIINYFNCCDLPTFYKIRDWRGVLPQIETMTINNDKSTAAQEIFSYADTFGKKSKHRSIALKFICVNWLIRYFKSL